MQKYYLDTNTIYNITKLPSQVLQNSFTSVFTILELLAGIKDESEYKKRKAVLFKLLQSKIEIDNALPDELKYRSFDHYIENYDFIEQRTSNLMTLVTALIDSPNYQAYTESTAFNSPMGHLYFKDIDDKISSNFITSTAKGIQEIKSIIDKSPNEQSLIYNEVTYSLDSIKNIATFFSSNPEINRSSTILGLSEVLAFHTENPDISTEEVYKSYNGLVSTYVDVYSNYCLEKMTTNGSPARNDSADLAHTCYLRNRKIKLVSDDKIYKRYLANDVFTIAEVINDVTVELKELHTNDADQYYLLLQEEDIRNEFAFDTDPQALKASILNLNTKPDISMTFGIFCEKELIGFVQLCRKRDLSKMDEFQETEDSMVQLFDEEYIARIEAKHLAVSPFFINIAISKAHRKKGYAKTSMRKLLELTESRNIKEIFMLIEHSNENSTKLALATGAELFSEDFFANVYKITL